MSHADGLLDTSTVILLGRIDPRDLPVRPRISAITLAELAVGPLATADGVERSRRQAELLQVDADFDPIPFGAPEARAFASVSASLRRAGRKATSRAFDALIAATAVANELPLYTCNPRDFDGIDELEVVAVPHPDPA